MGLPISTWLRMVGGSIAAPSRVPTVWDGTSNVNAVLSESGQVVELPGYTFGHAKSVFGASSGRWYVEVEGVSGNWSTGVVRSDVASGVDVFSVPTALVVYGANIVQNGAAIQPITSSAVYGLEFLCSTGQVWVYHNGGVAGPFTVSSLSGSQTYKIAAQSGNTASISERINAGQSSFVHGLPPGCEPIFGPLP